MDTATRTAFLGVAPHVAQLRHAAVHRLHLSHDAFLQWIRCACTLAEILHDAEDLGKLQALHSNVANLVKQLDFRIKVVRQQADAVLVELVQQRAVLGQKEQHLRDAVAQKQLELVAAAGRAILGPVEPVSYASGSRRRSWAMEITGRLVSKRRWMKMILRAMRSDCERSWGRRQFQEQAGYSFESGGLCGCLLPTNSLESQITEPYLFFFFFLSFFVVV